jgi:hypothetical protein
MIRKIVIFLLTLIGAGFMFVGCIGPLIPYYDHINWEYCPEDFALTRPQGRISFGLISIFGEWISLESEQPESNKNTFFYKWTDMSDTNEEGVSYRLRKLYIPIRHIPATCVGALFLIYPIIVFARGPYRRYRRRLKGQCIKCGCDLTGGVTGVCPECDKKNEPGAQLPTAS